MLSVEEDAPTVNEVTTSKPEIQTMPGLPVLGEKQPVRVDNAVIISEKPSVLRETFYSLLPVIGLVVVGAYALSKRGK